MDSRRSIELSTISQTEIAELLPRVVAAKLEEVAARKRFGRGSMIINTDLTKVPGQFSMDFLNVAEAPLAADVTAGNNIPQVDWSVAKLLTITATKKGQGTAIQREAVKAGNRDIVNMTLERLATSLARKEDFDIIKNELEAGAPTTDNFTGDGSTKSFTIAAGNRPIAVVDSATGTVSGVASKDLEVLSFIPDTGVVTVNLAADSGTAVAIITEKIGVQKVDCGTKDSLSVSELRQLRGKITQNRFDPDVLICGEEFYAIMVTTLSTLFVDRAKYQEGTELFNFEVGKILGMRVITTTELNPRLAIAKDSDRATVFVEKEGILVEHKYEPRPQVREVYASQIYGLGVLQSGAHAAIVLKS